MKCLDRFNVKMSLSGGSLRNEKIYSAKCLLDYTFEDDPAFITTPVYRWKCGLISPEDYNGEQSIKIRLSNETYSAANGTRIEFQTKYDTPIYVGDIIYHYADDEYWLCTESFNIDDINFQGKLTLCNWVLRWQDKQGVILNYPCYDQNTTQYNSGERYSREMTQGTAQHLVKLPADYNTIHLSTPQRFFLDRNKENPTPYVVTQNDTTTYNIGKNHGIVAVTLYQDVIDMEADNFELGICDYVDVKSAHLFDDTVDEVIAKIETDSNCVVSGGDSQLFIGKFYDKQGNEIEKVGEWNVISTFSDALNIRKDGNQIMIELDDDDYIDEEFKLIFTDEAGMYYDSMIVKIDSLL